MVKACSGWPKKINVSMLYQRRDRPAIIAGMGELHLELSGTVCSGIQVGANAGAPQIAYRETSPSGRG